MDDEEKKALSTSLPELIRAIIVDTRFKAAVTSSRFLDDDFTDRLFEATSESSAEQVFRLVQHLKKTGTQSSLEQFTGVLTKVGQHNAVAILQKELAAHSQGFQEDDDVKRYNINARPTASSAITSSDVSEDIRDDDIEEFRQGVAQTLPIKVAEGFIAVSAEYCDHLYDFVNRRITGLPGPLQLPDLTKPMHESDAFKFISPACSALLAKRYRGQCKILRYCKVGCWWQLHNMEGSAEYYRAIVVVQPGNIRNVVVWVSASATLQTAFAETTCFEHFRVTSHPMTSFVDLSLTIRDWVPLTKSNAVDVYRDTSRENSLSVTEKQQVLHYLLHAEGHFCTKVAVSPSCKSSVVKFSSGKTDMEPEQIKCLDSSAKAYNEANVSFITAEVCATVVEFSGVDLSSIKLTRGQKKTRFVLKENSEGNVKYIGAAIFVQPNGKHIGSFYLLGDASLRDGIAAAVGSYPEKVRTRGTDSDLDLDTAVREWFRHTKRIQIAVWL